MVIPYHTQNGQMVLFPLFDIYEHKHISYFGLTISGSPTTVIARLLLPWQKKHLHIAIILKRKINSKIFSFISDGDY
jgi:hypothetical protein